MADSQQTPGPGSDRPEREDEREIEPMGPLGEPISEPAPRGAFLLIFVFFLVLIVLWFAAYYSIWERGGTV